MPVTKKIRQYIWRILQVAFNRLRQRSLGYGSLCDIGLRRRRESMHQGLGRNLREPARRYMNASRKSEQFAPP